ncbi:MAG TPA: GGDEF domain-containing protein [Terriglobales bacterium]|nr:GGDEF domain-containing protein [Terriglobales bacterium]
MPQAATKRAWTVVFPGGLMLLAGIVLFLALRGYAERGLSALSYVSCSIFSAGLLLSAIFQRSRAFFVLLILGIADAGMTFAALYLSAARWQCVLDLTVVLVCANLFVLSGASDRGLLTLWGRWQMTLIAMEAAGTALLCATIPSQTVALLGRAWFSGLFSWSQISQLPLLVFAATLAILFAREWKRRTAVGSGILWALAAVGLGFEASPQPAGAAAGFAAGAAIVAIAVLENSYGMAFLDELTALPGRRSFNEALLKLGDEYAIAMVDVDHFKLFNDMFGHAAGDQVLQMVAGKLAAVGGGGSAFRYGGEEFAVIFPRAALDDVFPALEELRERIERVQFRVRGEERRRRRSKGPVARSADRRRPAARSRAVVAATSAPTNITVSIGVAEANPSAPLTPQQVIQTADKALYRAKQQGRNRVVASFERSGSHTPA